MGLMVYRLSDWFGWFGSEKQNDVWAWRKQHQCSIYSFFEPIRTEGFFLNIWNSSSQPIYHGIANFAVSGHYDSIPANVVFKTSKFAGEKTSDISFPWHTKPIWKNLKLAHGRPQVFLYRKTWNPYEPTGINAGHPLFSAASTLPKATDSVIWNDSWAKVDSN